MTGGGEGDGALWKKAVPFFVLLQLLNFSQDIVYNVIYHIFRKKNYLKNSAIGKKIGKNRDCIYENRIMKYYKFFYEYTCYP